jgi:DUF1016 N-terminal domain
MGACRGVFAVGAFFVLAGRYCEDDWRVLDGIRQLIAGARTSVARGVDLIQVHTNFEIGRRIVQEEQRGKDRAAYGKEVIKVLADRLTGEFGKGFSSSNLAYHADLLLALRRPKPNSPDSDWKIRDDNSPFYSETRRTYGAPPDAAERVRPRPPRRQQRRVRELLS